MRRHEGEEAPDEVLALGLVLADGIGEARLLGMHLPAAEVLLGDLLARGQLQHAGAGHGHGRPLVP